MSLFEALPQAHIARLSNPDQSYGAATQNEVAGDISVIFEQSMVLKTTLDTYEILAQRAPSWEVLAVLTNCEYRLWCLNAETPMRLNPFLSHWVAALQKSTQGASSRGSRDDRISTEQVVELRAEWIARLLSSKDGKELAHLTPRKLYQEIFRQGKRTDFDLEPYVQMLVEEGIWDEQSSTTVSKTRTPKAKAPAAKSAQPGSNQWKEDIKQKLQLQPEEATQDLIHLPLDIPHLDALTTLLAEGTFLALSIDPAPVITAFIQHSLRQIEQMGSPPSRNGIPTNGDTYGTEGREPLEYGKEAQSRAVRLLLLFMKSLIRKELLGIEVLYFEIQEICVRYVWIKEVRDFRSWVEEGGEG